MQFETWPEGDPTQEQIDKMKQAGLIKLYQYHGDHTYPAKVTKNFLENHNFDHVRWIGIVENKDPYLKIVQDYKDHFLSQNAVNIEIVLHGGENSEIAIITNLSNRVINIRGNNLIVNMNSSKLFKVLSFNFVRNVNPYSEPQKESLGEK